MQVVWNIQAFIYEDYSYVAQKGRGHSGRGVVKHMILYSLEINHLRFWNYCEKINFYSMPYLRGKGGT